MASTVACYRHGISRIEVCVMFLILALLTALILPAVRQSRESARRSECKNTLRNLAHALHNYHDAMGSFPYGCVGNSELPPEKRWSWYLCVGSYWGHYGTPIINYDRPWDDPTLRPLQLHTWRNGPYREFDVPLYPFPVIKCPNGTPKTHHRRATIHRLCRYGGDRANSRTPTPHFSTCWRLVIRRMPIAYRYPRWRFDNLAGNRDKQQQ